MTVRILRADDHGVVRQGLRMFLGLGSEMKHVGNILARLGAPSRTQAALYAIRVGLVNADG